MIKKSILILFLLFSCVMQAQPTLSLDWMKLEPEGYAIKIKKDSKGNAIVLARGDGNPYLHIITLKYNKSGALIWKRTYFDPLNGFPDIPEDIEVDSLDNIYVGGTVNYDGNGVSLNSRAILIKYDSLGNLIWKREYGSNINPLYEGAAWSLKIYNNKDIYLAGHVNDVNGNGYWKSFLAQYDSSGTLNWAYIDSSAYATFASNILVDKLGNSYLCGNTTCCPPGYNMFATKFDMQGNIKWKKVIDEPFHSYSYTHTAIISDSATVFLAGETGGTTTGTGYDSYIAKLDSSGNLRWTNILYKDSGINVFEGTTDILLDSSLNLYSFGYSGAGAGVTYFLQKIDNRTGSYHWIQWDSIVGLAKGILSRNNQIVFTGQDVNHLVIKSIDTNGILQWKYQISCQCAARDLFELDSSFFLAGANYQPFSTNEDSIMVCRINFDATTGLTSHSLSSDISAFPNPFTDKLYLSLSKNVNSIVKMEVHNLIGNKVYSNSDIKNSIIINTESWQAGIFILTIQTENGSYRSKLIKAK